MDKQTEQRLRSAVRALAAVLTRSAAVGEKLPLIQRLGVGDPQEIEARIDGLSGPIAAGEVEVAQLAALPELWAEAALEALVITSHAANLARLRESSADKGLSRRIGAAIHRLEGRGVEVPRAAPVRPRSPLAVEPPVAFVTPIDGQDEQMLEIFTYQEGPSVLESFRLSLEVGVKGWEKLDMSQGTYRRMIRESRVRGVSVPCEIPLHHALLLLQDACERSVATGRVVSMELYRLMQDLGRRAPPRREIPAAAVGVAPLRGEITPDVTRLVLMPHVNYVWAIPPIEMGPVFKGIREILSSPLVTSPELRKERLEAEIVKGGEQWFTPERRRRMAIRLDDLALYLSLMGGGELVPVAAGAARALEELATPAMDTPFAQLFFRAQFISAMEMLTPGGGAPVAEAPSAPESPLIIPGR